VAGGVAAAVMVVSKRSSSSVPAQSARHHIVEMRPVSSRRELLPCVSCVVNNQANLQTAAWLLARHACDRRHRAVLLGPWLLFCDSPRYDSVRPGLRDFYALGRGLLAVACQASGRARRGWGGGLSVFLSGEPPPQQPCVQQRNHRAPANSQACSLLLAHSFQIQVLPAPSHKATPPRSTINLNPQP
jgi:hypothetical protein